MESSPYKISFCTTCKGRVHHLKQTLPRNLANSTDYPNVEFVILDYDSRDGLEKWIKETYPREIESGKIRYAKFAPAEYFRFAHAKNLAHRAATGDILCNLDADNVIAPGFTGWLNEQFSRDKDIYVRPRRFEILLKKIVSPSQRGQGGRIAIHRDHFNALHGYDERYKGWGDDDGNFDARAHLAGFKRIKVPYGLLGTVVPHGDEERSKHSDPDTRKKTEEFLRFKRSLRGHIDRFRHFNGRQDTNPPSANTDGRFGCGTLRVNFAEDLELKPVEILSREEELVQDPRRERPEHRKRVRDSRPGGERLI